MGYSFPLYPITNGQLATVTFRSENEDSVVKTVGIYAPEIVTCPENEAPLLVDPVINGTTTSLPKTVKVISNWQEAIFGEGHRFTVGICVAPDDKEVSVEFRRWEVNLDMCPGGLANRACQQSR